MRICLKSQKFALMSILLWCRFSYQSLLLLFETNNYPVSISVEKQVVPSMMGGFRALQISNWQLMLKTNIWRYEKKAEMIAIGAQSIFGINLKEMNWSSHWYILKMKNIHSFYEISVLWVLLPRPHTLLELYPLLENSMTKTYL